MDKPALVEHIVVDDFEGQGAFDHIELIARCESAEMVVGVVDEEGEGERLRQVSEAFAVGRSEEFLESAPFLGVVARFEQFAVVVFARADFLGVAVWRRRCSPRFRVVG